jgi:hypothetical protein
VAGTKKKGRDWAESEKNYFLNKKLIFDYSKAL